MSDKIEGLETEELTPLTEEQQLKPTIEQQLEIEELANQQLQEQEPKNETIIYRGQAIDPTCTFITAHEDSNKRCSAKGVVMFKDFLTQKEAPLCKEHLDQKEEAYKTGNQAYEVSPFIDLSTKESLSEPKKKKKGKK